MSISSLFLKSSKKGLCLIVVFMSWPLSISMCIKFLTSLSNLFKCFENVIFIDFMSRDSNVTTSSVYLYIFSFFDLMSFMPYVHVLYAILHRVCNSYTLYHAFLNCFNDRIVKRDETPTGWKRYISKQIIILLLLSLNHSARPV